MKLVEHGSSNLLCFSQDLFCPSQISFSLCIFNNLNVDGMLLHILDLNWMAHADNKEPKVSTLYNLCHFSCLLKSFCWPKDMQLVSFCRSPSFLHQALVAAPQIQSTIASTEIECWSFLIKFVYKNNCCLIWLKFILLHNTSPYAVEAIHKKKKKMRLEVLHIFQTCHI